MSTPPRYSPQTKTAARRMRERGDSYSAIAARFGTSASTARRWCDSEAQAADVRASVAWKRENAEAAREHSAAVRTKAKALHKHGTCECGRPFSRSRDGVVLCRRCREENAWRPPPCKMCGTQLRVGRLAYEQGTGLCADCVHEPARARAQAIADGYMDGLAVAQIAAQLGVEPNYVKAIAGVLRKAGHPIPRSGAQAPPGVRIRVEVGDIAAALRGEQVAADRY